ncbi:MAG: VWA domain-containing protein [Bryobacteraceae bacterium]
MNSLLAAIALLVFVPVETPPAARPFTEYTGPELARAIPALDGLQPASDQGDLDELLKTTGTNLQAMLSNFVAASAAEEVHEIRYDSYAPAVDERERFRHVARFVTHPSGAALDEFRLAPATGQRVGAANGGKFPLFTDFIALTYYLLRENRDHCQFHLAGQMHSNGHDWTIVAFAMVKRAADSGTAPPLHGVYGIDAAHRVAMLHVEPRDQPSSGKLVVDLTLTPIVLPGWKGDLWLPSHAAVERSSLGKVQHSVHRFSSYRPFDEAEATPEVPAAADTSHEDATELMVRGMDLMARKKTAEAIDVLRVAVKMDPRLHPARYQLAMALGTSGDPPAAVTELREILKATPDDGPVHNAVGVILIARRDFAAAAEELRAAARLMPQESVVHLNLGQSLEASGDRQGALKAYRAALVLSPEDTKIKERLQNLDHASTAGPDTIRIDVRQVLLPVIVTGKDGHYVTGLKQSDFRVFEDGLEQKITAFSSETSTAVAEAVPSAAAEPQSQGSPAATKQQAPRYTFLICLDASHMSFSSLGSVRTDLKKLFEAEHAGDSRYLLVAVGRSMEVIQNTTADPAEILKTLGSRDFEKRFVGQNSMELEMSAFRRSLNEARVACDARDATCESRKHQLPLDAGRIARNNELDTMVLLRQIRDLVAQLARAPGRRSIVLISDGFQLQPGKEPFDLLQAYFTSRDVPNVSLSGVSRMQDEFEPVVRLAARNSITIHTVDARGLYTERFYDASDQGTPGMIGPAVLGAMNQIATDSAATLSELAAATGGTAFQNSNDISRGLRQAIADGREFYTLAYTPTNANLDGSFRKVTITVRDSRWKASTRRGYWAPSQ